MNGSQKLIRLGGLLILVLMAIFPPWKYSYTEALGGADESRAAGYHSLWSPPSEESEENEKNAKYHIDLLRLGIQFAGMLIAMNGGIYYLRQGAATR